MRVISKKNSRKFNMRVDQNVVQLKPTVIKFVQVYPESYWEGLKIGSNNSIYVEEGTSVRISEYDLREY